MAHKNKRNKKKDVQVELTQDAAKTTGYSGDQEWITEELANGGKFDWIP
ncbi:MAG: hypothetical protein SFV17_12750 [Candidatus Obscuribacter sp.]|nr:hypothetical protein [Candidatus Melainabacteria bacterium]MDX1987548.1 hypothetical protein [Candidatus Obscuribacter sp.]